MGWVDACNEHDLEGKLGRFHPEVRSHPLKLVGLDGAYRGYDGVRWYSCDARSCTMNTSSCYLTSTARAIIKCSRSVR